MENEQLGILEEENDLERKLVLKANITKVPLTVNFELTPCCNLNCDMCYIRMPQSHLEKHNGLLPLEKWLQIAKAFKKKGTLFILLTGGEPMLYPDFMKLYIALKEMGFIITINTNATLLTEEILNVFNRLKPRRVNVTLYGLSENTYSLLCHNKNGFDKCIRGLQLLKKYKVDTKLNISAVRKNFAEYEEFFTLARELSMPLEVNSYMFPCVRSVQPLKKNIINERLYPKEAALVDIQYRKYKKGRTFLQYKQRFKQWLQNGTPDTKPLGLDCRAGKSSCWINWQGRMSPCVAMEKPFISLREYSVDEAWLYIVKESEKLEKHVECTGCKLLPICDVCYAAACHEKKAVGNLSHLCEMAQWKKKYLLEE